MEERKMILKMIEEGKISAEDGAKLLEALKPPKEDKTKGRLEFEHQDTEPSENRSEDSSQPSDKKSLSTKVNWEEGNKRFDDEWSREKTGKTDFTTTFTDFIDSAIKKIKDMDLDFNFGTYQEVHHTFQHKDMRQKALDISLENGSVEMKLWEESDVKVVCDARVYRGRTTEEARRTFLDNTVFEAGEDELRFYTKTKSVKVNTVIYIPREEYEKIHLYTFNGHLQADQVTSDRFSVKAVNGSITMNGLDVKKFEAETVNGPIQMKYSHLDIADIKTMNGSIDIHSQIRDLEAESLNGTIECSLTANQDGRAELTAATGSIYVTVPDHLRIEGMLKTNVGNYNCTLDKTEVAEEKKDFIQKSLKFVSNPTASPRLRVDADTKTGSITVKPN
ncbi:DUF4097 family beta strand repeat-containing protein [Alteribacillus iranensis]|uniref:DUF4097 and DUF4098 domain-containing protein YvlB n=1 Tax=Alteribacillus iranensis TaxID=930128 RepID=A0A1I2EKS2_9BACI|nr:DUF4097 domain-containing protein [Alteribacillus iranensis]SFE93359.1 DUF4097 and DUF4098 domain-containing protein YvlB [Alteribacillus iranensis]